MVADSKVMFNTLRAMTSSVYNIDLERVDSEIDPKYDLDKFQNQALLEIMELLMETTYFHVASKVWLATYGTKLTGIQSILKRDYGITYADSSLKAILYKDRQKFLSDFGVRAMREITGTDLSMIDYYRKRLNDIRIKRMLDDITLPRPKYKENGNTNVSREDIENFIETVLPYTSLNVKRATDSINTDVLRYINSLLQKEELSKQDAEHMEMLKRIIV